MGKKRDKRRRRQKKLEKAKVVVVKHIVPCKNPCLEFAITETPYQHFEHYAEDEDGQ